VPLPLLRDQRQRGEAPSHAELRYRIEACCFDSGCR
jgi:hypothetical protein